MSKKLLILAGATMPLVVSFMLFDRPCKDCSPVLGKNQIKIGETFINVELADTPEERTQGLSGRQALADGSGLLFVFENPGKHGFWMKDMRFAIDIIWISEGMEVAGIERAVTPESYPQVFLPKEEVKYVLEVPAGFSERQSIEVGEILSIGQ